VIRFRVLLLALALSLLVQPGAHAGTALGSAPDWSISGGRHFTQAGSFSVVDDAEARFWTEFQRLGGVARVGYPVSNRFVYKGFVTQLFQKHALQWRPGEGRALFANLFDELTTSGKDDWLLAVRSTPRPVAIDETGWSWAEIVRGRLALLDANPAIARFYHSSPSSIDDFGLPTSRVEDLGPLYAIRTQRAVLQQWKVDVPWAAAGEVVIANGGDVAKEAGLFPREILAEAGAAQAPEAVAAPLPAAAPAAEDRSVLGIINSYRAAAGVPPARIHPALEQAARGHVAYYDANRGDPALAGMGLHSQTPGKPGFTGATMGERGRAAGYTGGTITENAGFGRLEKTIDWHMNTVNHRLPLIHPGAVDIGFAESSATGFNIIMVGVRRDRAETAMPSVYPGPGATNVPTSWDGSEAPDPAPGLPRPLGYPITVAFGTYQRVEWVSFELTGPGGEALAISAPKKDWMRSAAIVPHRPLRPGTTYTVRVQATVDGQPVVREWSFTTRQ
jgi:uncharacterized protein YkwD